MRTIPEIKAEADEEIWKEISTRLALHMEQKRIAAELEVSQSWLSRYMNKNADRIKAHPEISNWAYRCQYQF